MSIMNPRKKHFCIEYARSGKSRCKYKACGSIIEGRSVRVGRVMYNPFDPDQQSDLVHWYHMKCLLDCVREKQESSTSSHKKPCSIVNDVAQHMRSTKDLKGFGKLKPEDKNAIEIMLQDSKDTAAQVTDTTITWWHWAMSGDHLAWLAFPSNISVALEEALSDKAAMLKVNSEQFVDLVEMRLLSFGDYSSSSPVCRTVRHSAYASEPPSPPQSHEELPK